MTRTALMQFQHTRVHVLQKTGYLLFTYPVPLCTQHWHCTAAWSTLLGLSYATVLGVTPDVAGILVCHGLLNTIGTKLAALLNGFSSVWHMVGTLVIVIVLLAVAPTHQSRSFVFGTFYRVGTAEIVSGITNNG